MAVSATREALNRSCPSYGPSAYLNLKNMHPDSPFLTARLHLLQFWEFSLWGRGLKKMSTFAFSLSHVTLTHLSQSEGATNLVKIEIKSLCSLTLYDRPQVCALSLSTKTLPAARHPAAGHMQQKLCSHTALVTPRPLSVHPPFAFFTFWILLRLLINLMRLFSPFSRRNSCCHRA